MRGGPAPHETVENADIIVGACVEKVLRWKYRGGPANSLFSSEYQGLRGKGCVHWTQCVSSGHSVCPADT